MEKRIDYYNVAPDAMQIMMEMEKYTKKNGIDRKLRELIKIRASQINGCAFCMNMHTADAQKMGETEQRLFCISAWRECTFYSEEEKVALELTEHITLVYYTEKEYVDLVILINQINSWNRISIAMGNFAE